MSLRRRVHAAEAQFGSGRGILFPVFMAGPEDEQARDRTRAALARGGKVRIISCILSLQADSVEEARELVEKHRKTENDQSGVEVHRRGGRELLASWQPEPPDWLQTLRDEDQG